MIHVLVGADLGFILTDFLNERLSRVSNSFKQDIGQFHSPRKKPCNLESFFFIKNIIISMDQVPEVKRE